MESERIASRFVGALRALGSGSRHRAVRRIVIAIVMITCGLAISALGRRISPGIATAALYAFPVVLLALLASPRWLILGAGVAFGLTAVAVASSPEPDFFAPGMLQYWLPSVAIGAAALLSSTVRKSRSITSGDTGQHPEWPERLLDATPELACIVGLDGALRQVNRALAEYVGRTSAQLTSNRFASLLHKEDEDALNDAVACIATGSQVQSFQMRVRRANGEYRLVEWICPATLPGEDFFYAAGREVVEGENAGQCEPAAAGGLRLAIPDDDAVDLCEAAESRETGASENTDEYLQQWRAVQRHDEAQPTAASAFPPHIGSASEGASIHPPTVSDSLRWKGDLRALLEMQSRLERAMRSAFDGLWDWDIAADHVWYSPRFRELLGYEADDQFPERFASFEARLHPSDHDSVMSTLRDHLEQEDRTFDVECRLRTKRGSWKWFRVRGLSFRDRNNGAVRMSGAICDVSDVKKLTNSLAESKEQIRSLLDGSSEGIFGIDLDGNCTFCNSTCAEMLGYSDPAELVHRPVDELIRHSSPDASQPDSADCRIRRALTAGEECVCQDEVFWRADGTSIPVEYRSFPIQKKGRVTGAVVAFRNIREGLGSQKTVREQEAQFQHSQRMEAVGELAGGVAHEFNDLMQTITGCAQFAQQNLPSDSCVHADLEHLLSASERAAMLTRQLLNFSRRDTIRPVPICVADALTELMATLRLCIPESISLQVDIQDGDAAISADPSLLQQILMHLCVNARDAMDSVGTILIRSRKIAVEKQRGLSGEVEPGEYVQLSITDTGPGVPDELQSRIFEPFFTTKEAGKGTGMGLAMVFGVVQQHGGFVRVSSGLNEGATFQVHLPLCHDVEPAELSQLIPEPPVVGGDEFILVAEDNAVVRDVVVRVLESAGYRTVAAEDGEQAVELFSQQADDIDMLLFDIVMPNMSGKDAAATIRLIQPDIPVVFCTGCDATSEPIKNTDLRSTFLVEKPFAKGSLLRTVRMALDGRHSGEASQEHVLAGGEK